MLDKFQQPHISTDFSERLRAYIESTLHQPVRLAHWRGSTGLPVFLSQRYDFFTGMVSNQRCLFAIDPGVDCLTPAEIARHLAHIERAFDGIVIYAAQRLSADRRARLITKGAPFVIPGNQLYIPQLALDLREYFRARPKPRPEQLSPVAQAVLFHHLLHPSNPGKALQDSYSEMSVWRAYEELRQLDLVKVTKRGRNNRIALNAGPRHLIDMARPYLRNPVRGQKNVSAGFIAPHIMQAGEAALAELTNLSPPALPVCAVHYKDWGSMAGELELTEVEFVEDADSVIELWHYDPKLLAPEGIIVDRLSLHAQFWNHPDERVAKSAEDLLEQVSW